jgi:hypothetical protein
MPEEALAPFTPLSDPDVVIAGPTSWTFDTPRWLSGQPIAAPRLPSSRSSHRKNAMSGSGDWDR